MIMDRRKPAGIVIIAIYGAVGGIVSLLVGLSFMLASGVAGTSQWSYLLAVIFLAFGIMIMASVYGLWTLQGWGWHLSLWVYAISVLFGIIAIFPVFPGSTVTPGNTLFQLFGVVVDLVVILYIRKDRIRRLYLV